MNIKKVKEGKRILFFLVLGILILPLFQNVTKVIQLEELQGVFVAPETPIYSFDEWFSGAFQDKAEKHLQFTFEFRRFLVRLYNQINLSCFHQLSNEKMFLGDENIVFEHDIVNSYYGEFALKKDTIYNELLKLKFVQDTLQKLNKNIVFAIAPTKASLLHDFIPLEYRKTKHKNNYETFVETLKELNINYIDFTAYFKECNPTKQYLVFPPTGVHWATYSTTFAIDTLLRFMGKSLSFQPPAYRWGPIEEKIAQNNDRDSENALNLFFNVSSKKLAYKSIQVDRRINDSIKVLAMGDSFYEELYNTGLNRILSSTSEFWYYGRYIKLNKSELQNEELHFYQCNLEQKIKESDLIVILFNEANLHALSYKFIDRLYLYFNNQSSFIPYDVAFFEYVKKRMVEIKKDPVGFEKIRLNAIRKNIPADSMLKVQAILDVEKAVWSKQISITK